MPPKQKISKTDIIDVAFSILKEEGMEKVSAREISKKLNCSTQPIFIHFTSMDNLKEVLINKSLELYQSYIYAALEKELPYLASGIAYINLAKNEKEIFKLLFMKNYHFSSFNTNSKDSSLNDIYKVLIKQANITLNKAIKFHQSMWIYTHGIATMLATDYMSFSEQEIKDLLSIQYNAYLQHYRKES